MSADMSEVDASEKQENAREWPGSLDLIKIVKIAMRTSSSSNATVVAELDSIMSDLGALDSYSGSSSTFFTAKSQASEILPQTIEEQLRAASVDHVRQVLDDQERSRVRSTIPYDSIPYDSIPEFTLTHYEYHTDESTEEYTESDSDLDSQAFQLMRTGM